MSLPERKEVRVPFEAPEVPPAPVRIEGVSPAPLGDEPGAASRLFPLLWNLFRIAVWAIVVVAMFPQVLELVGQPEIYRWVGAHPWVRWAVFPVLAPLFLVSTFQVLNVRRRGGTSGAGFAPQTPPADASGFDRTLGLRIGEPQTWTLEGCTVEAGSWVSQGNRRFVASTRLPVFPSLAFSARDPRMEPAWMRGLAQQAIRAGVEQMRSSRPEMAATFAAMEFLTRDPIPLPAHPLEGDLLLRASDPSRAIELFADLDVVREVRALDRAGKRWELTLMPDGTSGESLLRFVCPGSDRSPELAQSTQRLMGAVLRRLAS